MTTKYTKGQVRFINATDEVGTTLTIIICALIITVGCMIAAFAGTPTNANHPTATHTVQISDTATGYNGDVVIKDTTSGGNLGQ